MAFTISNAVIGNVPTIGSVVLRDTEITTNQTFYTIKQYVGGRWQKIPIPGNSEKIWNIRLGGLLISDADRTDLRNIDDNGKYSYDDNVLSLGSVVIINMDIRATTEKNVYDFSLELEEYNQT